MIILLFGLLNTPAVQEYAKNIIVDELKAKLGTELGIGKLNFQPFNTMALDSVYLYDQSGKQILLVKRISAGINIFSLLQGDIIITSAWLSDFELSLSKESPQAPLNIQYILDAFKSKDKKPKSKVNFIVNSLNISNGKFYYDVEDQWQKDNGLDVNHILVSDFNAKLTLKSLNSDSLNIQVKKMELKEKSGFEISDLVFRIISQEKKYSIRGFNLDLPSSSLVLNRLELDLTPTNDTASIADYAIIDAEITPSNIAPKDIAALVPALKEFHEVITLEGKLSGKVDDFVARNISLNLDNKISLLANIEVKDIRNKDKTYILGKIDELVATYDALETIADNFSKKKVNIPKQVKNLGRISFIGDVSGYLNQLTAFGSFETDLGIIKADVLFGFAPRKGIDSFVKGNVLISDFLLGNLLDKSDFEKVTFKFSVDVEKPVHHKIKGKAEGQINEFGYKGYTYNDIILDVAYDGLIIDGSLKIDDPNGKLNIAGQFDLSDKDNPELTFVAKVKDVQLDDLNLMENMKYSHLSFDIDADFTGKDIDNAIGYIKIDSLDFIRDNKAFQMDHFTVEVLSFPDSKELSIESDLLTGNVKGVYSFRSIANDIKQTLKQYLPSLITADQKRKPDEIDNIFEFDFTVDEIDNLSDVFKIPVKTFGQTNIKGNYNNISDKFNVEISAPALKAAGMNIKEASVSIDNQEGMIVAAINTSIMGKKKSINEITIHSEIKNDHINTELSLTNKGFQKAEGKFYISTLFTRDETNLLAVDLDIKPSKLLLNNMNWEMNESHINIQENVYAIDNFRVSSGDKNQEIKIDGKYSTKNTNDILKAELKNIDLEYIFETLAIDALRFGGYATGNIFVSTIESKPYANTRLGVTDFKFNGTDLGGLSLFSEFDEETNMVMMEGQIVSKEKKETKVNGTIDPIKQKLSIYFDADSVDMSFLNKYTSVLFDDVRGRGTGNVHLHGNFSDVTVEGKAFIKDGNLGINFLNTRYNFSDTVYMKKDLIYFNNMNLIDQHNNIANVSGKVTHDYFHDFTYTIELTANKFLLYNATQAQNPFFYGKVFGSGSGTVSGDEQVVDIDVRMRTEDKTLVRMNFMEDYINEYSFITYKSKDTIQTKHPIVTPQPIKTDSEMAINMNFYIDATPDAIVELVMDPIGGDILRGSGSGAMQFQWTTSSSPRLFGTYNIVRGSYYFTFQRIMDRRFMIQEGSNVQFRGDPFEALLDVNAIYKINASLYDLDKYLAQNTGQSTIPVNCVLNLTGPLRHPNIGLDITFPSADSEVARQLKSLINTEDEINKQVASLLIMSKFRAPQYGNVENPTSDFAAIASATLSNQLTKLVSQIDSRWQLGTNIRYYDESMTYAEAELLLSSQLLNDRLLINGNFGYRRNDLNNVDNKEVMIHDVDIEYLLNNAGTWRIKAYNHYNEKFYYTDKATQTQGVGIIYKKDFDQLYELFHRTRPRFPIPSDTIKPIVPDSLQKGSPLSRFIRLKK